MAFAGIDVGTSGCKVCIFDVQGRLLGKTSRSYRERRGNNIREIVPQEVKTAVFEALGEAAAACGEPIWSLCVTCLGESLVILDEKGNVLANSMVTGDNRGVEEVRVVTESIGTEETFAITGLTPSSLYTLPKLIWMKEHTDVLQKARMIFFYEDYIGYLLTGERKVSFSSAARSMALDIHQRCWSDRLLSLAGLTPLHFSTPVPSGTIIGTVRADVAELLHLSPGIPVIAGAHDQACAALGSGFTDRSIAEDGIGTCECLALLLPDEGLDEGILKRLDMPCMTYPLFSPGAGMTENAFFTTLEVTTCGALMNWTRDVLLKGVDMECAASGKNFFAHMDERVAGMHTNLLMLPQLGSSGHPDLCMNSMVGTIWGLTLDTTVEDFFLAAKESMVYQLRLAHEAAAGLHLDFDRIVLTGGAAHSKVTAQIRADVFNKSVYTMANNEAGALGCMILSAVALGYYPSIVRCIRSIVSYADEILPIPANVQFQEEKYQRFKELYSKAHRL